MNKRINLRLFACLLVSFVILFGSVLVFAQDGSTPTTEPGVSPWSLLIGSGITILVTLLKRISFVDNNPKLVAMVLSVVVTAVTAIAGAHAGSGIWPFVITAVTQLAAAIGTHEVLVKTLTPTPKTSPPLS